MKKCSHFFDDVSILMKNDILIKVQNYPSRQYSVSILNSNISNIGEGYFPNK